MHRGLIYGYYGSWLRRGRFVFKELVTDLFLELLIIPSLSSSSRQIPSPFLPFFVPAFSLNVPNMVASDLANIHRRRLHTEIEVYCLLLSLTEYVIAANGCVLFPERRIEILLVTAQHGMIQRDLHSLRDPERGHLIIDYACRVAVFVFLQQVPFALVSRHNVPVPPAERSHCPFRCLHLFLLLFLPHHIILATSCNCQFIVADHLFPSLFLF